MWFQKRSLHIQYISSKGKIFWSSKWCIDCFLQNSSFYQNPYKLWTSLNILPVTGHSPNHFAQSYWPWILANTKFLFFKGKVKKILTCENFYCLLNAIYVFFLFYSVRVTLYGSNEVNIDTINNQFSGIKVFLYFSCWNVTSMTLTYYEIIAFEIHDFTYFFTSSQFYNFYSPCSPRSFNSKQNESVPVPKVEKLIFKYWNCEVLILNLVSIQALLWLWPTQYMAKVLTF